MIQVSEIQNAIASVLKEKTGYKVYKNNVIEAFQAPCFFVSVRIAKFEPANKSTFSVETECSIEYYPFLPSGERVRDDIPLEKLMSLMPMWFSPNIHVGDRYLVTENRGFRFSGENADILHFDFSLSYFDGLDNEGEADNNGDDEKITQVEINHKSV
ncbi:MAG: hypothetical protein NC122_06295 [Faecalibacterium sp.]|nr:hypothetical protein [Ruminococcus sp.]MCM1392104.1 hypothetical protein [Ruminococcus sp.]MCM1485801.1 hypothetical protein [Faecalibacterium sp.]